MARLISDSERMLNLWVKYFNENNALGILTLYDANACLIPTFSSDFFTSNKTIKGYFSKLFTKQLISVTVEENKMDELNTTNCQIIFGVYTFTYMDEGTLITVPSRYTFLLDLERSRPILHHHSSKLPTKTS